MPSRKPAMPLPPRSRSRYRMVWIDPYVYLDIIYIVCQINQRRQCNIFKSNSAVYTILQIRSTNGNWILLFFLCSLDSPLEAVMLCSSCCPVRRWTQTFSRVIDWKITHVQYPSLIALRLLLVSISNSSTCSLLAHAKEISELNGYRKFWVLSNNSYFDIFPFLINDIQICAFSIVDDIVGVRRRGFRLNVKFDNIYLLT